ncbi:PREDICTED: protein tramtrack, beta isoform isoform X3 [Vollenhovia emeryi]|uniref:protein tramtrack, beta isoform isoform X3 n=1 Tax=Vollenhovia emeryi TaxID=411798 RepID=UPI0005F41547|nr:PREDICTED: protein tramtrack, beta isoform isoform X3 [Vollenhovia emeryi]
MLADINGNLADLRSEAMASQRFCLRWNNHQSNLLSVFDQLLHDESFVDVTLAVEGQLLRAHKMVLSACSPYFQALFVGHPDKHPIVILKDVPYVDMRSLLDFMYRGEVSVDQDRLTAFLRVAESLRIKGLTEVNEDKCDLPNITSSLLGGNQNAVAPPPPSLHRINQIGQHHHHAAQKRFHHMSSHPLLGSALTAPKRKRGRPRKLSGSSDTPISEVGGQDLQSCSGADLVQGSPEMMEMKMGLDFQSEVSGNGNVRNASSSNNNVGASSASAANNSAAAAAAAAATASSGSSSARRDEPTENGTDTPETPVTRVKREPEPTPSTSQASDETFARPHSRQGSEGFKQEFSPSKTDSSETWKEKTRGMNTGTSPATTSMDVSSSPSSPSNARASTSSSAPTTNAAPTTTSAGGTPTTTSAGGALTRSSSGSPASRNSGGGANANITAMSAPSGRQAPKRRMRRRATSQSQDPAEQLTEMSVRGLNLFRYASINEGVYQCTECAKLDIQKTFKNKYSFQRHAFLYHEGHQRKVFPCPVCAKEFSRPDKMKNHMKTVHDCFMPKDCVMPFSFFLPGAQ